MPLAVVRLAAADGGPAHGTATIWSTPAGLTIDMQVDGLTPSPAGTFYTCWLVGAGDTLTHPNRVSVGSFVPKSWTPFQWAPFDGAGGAFHDNGSARVSLVSTATIRGWDRRRFRANVLLDGDSEDSLVGSRVALGQAVLDVGTRIERCVMTTRPQPGGIERDLNVLRTINRDRDGCLAIGALVVQPGTVRVGDALTPI